jgi:hypothetical protein
VVGRFQQNTYNMPAAVQPALRSGRVYRTGELSRWGANPPRLAKRLVREGKLTQVARGLFACPRRGRFGAVPPTDEELMRAFLDGSPFVFTGPERWNALGLGTTAAFAVPVVYNHKRSGKFDLGGRRFVLRRVAFPEKPMPEWFVVDLFENARSAGTSPEALVVALRRAIGRRTFEPERLREAARRFGTRRTQAFIERSLDGGRAP